MGKNQPLLRKPVLWSSDVITTEGQLQSKRDEFWDTAPAFEGSRVVWDALKGAAEAAELEDYDLAQAIIDGAGISLPRGTNRTIILSSTLSSCVTGTLEECYDELGNRYVVPSYCLSRPSNMTNASSNASSENETPSTALLHEERINVKLRLSTGKDIKLAVHPSATMTEVKRMLQSSEGIDVVRTKILFSGKIISDSTTIEQLKIPKGFVLQVVVS